MYWKIIVHLFVLYLVSTSYGESDNPGGNSQNADTGKNTTGVNKTTEAAKDNSSIIYLTSSPNLNANSTNSTAHDAVGVTSTLEEIDNNKNVSAISPGDNKMANISSMQPTDHAMEIAAANFKNFSRISTNLDHNKESFSNSSAPTNGKNNTDKIESTSYNSTNNNATSSNNTAKHSVVMGPYVNEDGDVMENKDFHATAHRQYKKSRNSKKHTFGKSSTRAPAVGRDVVKIQQELSDDSEEFNKAHGLQKKHETKVEYNILEDGGMQKKHVTHFTYNIVEPNAHKRMLKKRERGTKRTTSVARGRMSFKQMSELKTRRVLQEKAKQNSQIQLHHNKVDHKKRAGTSVQKSNTTQQLKGTKLTKSSNQLSTAAKKGEESKKVMIQRKNAQLTNKRTKSLSTNKKKKEKQGRKQLHKDKGDHKWHVP